jgi:hypothetical protein
MTACRALALSAAVLLLGCAETPRDIEVRVWGEAFVEDVLPASEVSDGWEIEFSEFVVSIGEVFIDVDGESIALPGWSVYDLTLPTDGLGQAFAMFETSGELDRIHYRIGRPTEATDAGNARAAQRQRLAEGGYALWVAGEARRDGEVVLFEWGFPMEYGHSCALDQDIATPQPDAVTLTIHADHLVLDDLEVDPQVAFDAIADADSDGDGLVVPAELAAVDVRTMERYSSGSRQIPDLWNFIGALAGTLGHVDGEGGCEPVYTPLRHLGRTNPYDTADATGAELYAQHCASCHGSEGRGDGPSSDVGWPRPTDFTRSIGGALADDYLFFRIREGGGFFPFNSSMTSFGALLDEDETWRVVAHVQSLSHGGH